MNHCDFSSDGKLIATSGNDEKVKNIIYQTDCCLIDYLHLQLMIGSFGKSFLLLVLLL